MSNQSRGVIIKALEDSLANPRVPPRAKAVLRKRLEHHKDVMREDAAAQGMKVYWRERKLQGAESK